MEMKQKVILAQNRLINKYWLLQVKSGKRKNKGKSIESN